MSEFRIIQGDSYKVKINFINVDVELIDKMQFSCKDLNFCKEVEFDDVAKDYVINLTPNETATMSECVSDYDITAKFKDGSVKTLVYRKKLIVQKKVNTCG